MDKKTILKFKSKLRLKEKTIKQFALEHNFSPAIFSMAINEHTNLRYEYEQAIKEYLKS